MDRDAHPKATGESQAGSGSGMSPWGMRAGEALASMSMANMVLEGLSLLPYSLYLPPNP